MEDPFVLLRRLRLGREEYCQRLLTMLVLEGPYPRWNTRSHPSPRGSAFLRALDELSFGEASVGEEVTFVDEMDLPPERPGEPGGAPDYGLLTPGRLWVIELKTEKDSHRPDQLPTYVRLGRHHHPDLRLDLTYLTPSMRTPSVDVPADGRFAHVVWDDVLPLVQRTWSEAGSPWADLQRALGEAIATIGSPWADWRQTTLDDLRSLGLRVARSTYDDGVQRALDLEVHSLDDLHRLRTEVRDALAVEGRSDVQPWVWNEATSGGVALTETGRAYGFELRFSRGRA